jgi:hypothetical protein
MSEKAKMPCGDCGCDIEPDGAWVYLCSRCLDDIEETAAKYATDDRDDLEWLLENIRRRKV